MRSPDTWVFWVYAGNAARFEQGFRDIADCVKLTGRQDPQANIFKLVHDWLRNSGERWLLVLDNLDDTRFLVQGNGQGQATSQPMTAFRPLRDYIPYCERGSILVTTRSKEVALEIVEQRDMIVIEPMDKATAIALFKKKLAAQGNSQDDQSEVAELAVALEYMPLAIVQAAAYISQRAPRHSVAKYLEEFRRNREGISLLDYDAGQLRRDRDAKNSIFTTWQISFEHLQRTKPSAADLLSLMSFFDRQGIPEELIRSQKSGGASTASGSKALLGSRRLKNLFRRDKSKLQDQQRHKETEQSGEVFEDNVTALRNLCFISVDVGRATFEMHRLVQLATQKWLAANGRHEQWNEQFIANLNAAFPSGIYENWATCQALFAHVKLAAEQRPKNASSLTEWAVLLKNAAWYAWMMGNAAEAEALAVTSFETLQTLRGWEDEETLDSMRMVGLAYKLGGKWDQAAQTTLQHMETSKKKFGEDDLRTLESTNNLASTHYLQGRWADSEALMTYVVQMRKTKLGDSHPSTLSSIANLAATYQLQERLDDAEKLNIQVMEKRKALLGNNHPDTLSSMANLAVIYGEQGRLEDAEKLEIEVMEKSKAILGDDHPHTLDSMGNLAATYNVQGRLKEAEELQVQVTQLSKTKLGAEHPSTLTSMRNLALTWKSLGRNAEAAALMKQCVQQSQQVLRADHPNLTRFTSELEEWEAEQAGVDSKCRLKDVLSSGEHDAD